MLLGQMLEGGRGGQQDGMWVAWAERAAAGRKLVSFFVHTCQPPGRGCWPPAMGFTPPSPCVLCQDEMRRVEAARREAERNRHKQDREKEKELELIRQQYLVGFFGGVHKGRLQHFEGEEVECV